MKIIKYISIPPSPPRAINLFIKYSLIYIIATSLFFTNSISHATLYFGPEVDKSIYVDTLTKTKVEGKLMTQAEVYAMEPACLVIGMGRATGSRWGMPEATYKDRVKPDLKNYSMLWVAQGKQYAQWFHHYCWGELERYRHQSAANTKDKNSHLRKWIDSLNYVIRDSKGANWIYQNKVQGDLAAAQLASGKPAQAIATARDVLSAEPKLVNVHITLIDALTKTGKKADAVIAAQNAIDEVGPTKALVRRYKKLTGEDPKIGPVSAESLTVQQEASPENSDSNKDTTSHITSTNDDSTSSKSRNSANQDFTPQGDNEPAARNPYCRFCP